MKEFCLSVYQIYCYLLLVGLLHQRTYLQIRKFRIVSIQQFLQMRKFSGRNFRYKVSTSAKQGKETVSTSPLFQTNSELASSSSSANNDDSFAFTPN